MPWPGTPDPFSILAAFLSRYETGGVRKVKEKVRSGLMVMSVGIGRSGLKCAVRALLEVGQHGWLADGRRRRAVLS